jgi:predicted nucleotidyltransferase
MTHHAIAVPEEQIAAFCRKWKVKELALFGSVLREDFRADSDVDVLVTLEEGTRWNLRNWIAAQDELRELFGRDIDLVEKRNLVNPFRRHAILSSKEVLYSASTSAS